MKICHLHLEDSMGNAKTLVCRLEDGSIRYVSFFGWGSSGMGNSLSNFQCDLPMDKNSEDETVEQFKQRVIDTVNKKSIYRVVKEVSTNVVFAL
jgi:hypothetical protein